MNVPEQPQEPSSAKRKSKWPKLERDLLRQYVEEFRQGDAGARKLLLTSTVLPKYWALGENKNMSRADRKERRREIKAWYHNVARRNGLKTRFSAGSRVTLKRVTAYRKAKQIEEVVKRLSGVDPGDPGYFPFYQQGLSTVFKDLTPDEMEELKKEQQEWKTKKYPEEIQRKTATKHGERVIMQSDEVRIREMGMRSITWEFHVNNKGQLVFACHDNNESLGDRPVKRLSDMFKEIHEEYEQAFSAYAKYVYEIDQGHETDEHIPTRRNVRSPLVLPASVDGYPLLPAQNIESGEVDENLDEMRRLVRAFLCQNYNLASGRASGKVPFGKLALDNDSFVDAQYRPPGLTLQDPSMLKRHELEACLKFWRNRQNSLPASQVFRFTAYLTGNGNAKEIVGASYPGVTVEEKTRKRAPVARKKGKKKGKAKSGQKDILMDEMSGDESNPPHEAQTWTEPVELGPLNIGSPGDDRTPPMNPLELNHFLEGQNEIQTFDEDFFDPNMNIFDPTTFNDMTRTTLATAPHAIQSTTSHMLGINVGPAQTDSWDIGTSTGHAFNAMVVQDHGLLGQRTFGPLTVGTDHRRTEHFEEMAPNHALWTPTLAHQPGAHQETNYAPSLYQYFNERENAHPLYLPASTYGGDAPDLDGPPGHPSSHGLDSMLTSSQNAMDNQARNALGFTTRQFTFPPDSAPTVSPGINTVTGLGHSKSPAKRSLLTASIADGRTILPPRARPRAVEPRPVDITTIGDVPDSHFVHRRAQKMGEHGGHHNFITPHVPIDNEGTPEADQTVIQRSRKRAISSGAEDVRPQGSKRRFAHVESAPSPLLVTEGSSSMEAGNSVQSSSTTNGQSAGRPASTGRRESHTSTTGPYADVGPVIGPSAQQGASPDQQDVVLSSENAVETAKKTGSRRRVAQEPSGALKRSSRIPKGSRKHELLDVIEAGLLAKVKKSRK